MKYAIHDFDYYLSGHRFIIAWKLYPINECGEIIDEDDTPLFVGRGGLEFTDSQLFSPGGRVDTFHPMSKSQ